MINLLVLTIEFAPYQSTGAFRTIYFTKYLEKYGIRPIVITIEPDKSIERFKSSYNPKLNDLLGVETVVFRSRLRDYSYSKLPILSKLQQYFKIHDRYTKFWKRAVLNDIPKIIEEYSPQAVFTSLPFFSQADLAVEISKKYNLPLILDMRDNWSKWCISPYSTYFHYYLTYNKERKAFKAASKIISVTDELQEIFIKSHPNIDAKKFTVIPNGYDGDIDFNKKVSFKGNIDKNSKVTIAYVGSYYYNPKMHKDMMTPRYKKLNHKVFQYSPVRENWLYRSPYFFLKTLRAVLDMRPELESKVSFSHFGDVPSWLIEMIKEFNLEKIFKAKGFVSYHKLNQELKNVDFFLSTAVKVEGGNDYALASKTFEYIKFNKPILAFTPKGAQSKFIRNSNSGVIFNPDDEIKVNAQKMIGIIEEGISCEINKEFLQEYTRKNQALKLAKALKCILNH